MHHALAARGLVAAFGASLALLLGTADAAPDPTTLVYRAKKDDVFRYRFALKATLDTTGSPFGDGSIVLTQEQFVTFRVLAVDEKGTLHLRATLDRLRGGFEMAALGSQISFDTDDPPPDGAGAGSEEPLGKFARALKGGSFEVWLTAQGKVHKVAGATKLVEAAREKVGDTGGGGDLPFMNGLNAATLGEQFNDRGVAELLQAALPRLPEAPVEVGDSWESPGAVGVAAIGHDLKIGLTLALAEVSGDSANLLAAGGVTAVRREAAPAKGAPGGDFGADLMKNLKLEVTESSVDGTVRWSLGKSLLDESAITAKLTSVFEMKMPDMGGGGDAGGPGMKMDVKGTVRSSAKLLSLTHGTGGEGF